MKYRVQASGAGRDVDVRALGPDADGTARFEVALAGRPAATLKARADGDAVTFEWAGSFERAIVLPGRARDGVDHVFLRGEVFAVETTRGSAGTAGAAAGPRSAKLTVASPMPGRVILVRVRPGDRVARGDLLVTLEAMKMQNEFTASASGTVVAVRVGAGQVAGAGEALVEIEPDAPTP